MVIYYFSLNKIHSGTAFTVMTFLEDGIILFHTFWNKLCVKSTSLMPKNGQLITFWNGAILYVVQSPICSSQPDSTILETT